MLKCPRALTIPVKEQKLWVLFLVPKKTIHQMGDKKKKKKTKPKSRQMTEKGNPEVSAYVTTQSHGDIQCNKKGQKEIIF